MNKIYWLAGFTLVATLAILTLTLGDFLALHDIQKDYVSEEVLETLGIKLSGDLPDWTATAGEWAMVQFSYFARAAFLVLNVITLTLCVVYIRSHLRRGVQAP